MDFSGFSGHFSPILYHFQGTDYFKKWLECGIFKLGLFIGTTWLRSWIHSKLVSLSAELSPHYWLYSAKKCPGVPAGIVVTVSAAWTCWESVCIYIAIDVLKIREGTRSFNSHSQRYSPVKGIFLNHLNRECTLLHVIPKEILSHTAGQERAHTAKGLVLREDNLGPASGRTPLEAHVAQTDKRHFLHWRTVDMSLPICACQD